MPSRPRVLLVDDDPNVRQVLKLCLQHSGFNVIECADGVEALDAVSQALPSLIIMDVDMPRLDGWKTLKKLREQDLDVPVLMLTNRDDVPARVKGLDEGADDYLGKPCDMTELLARVKALLRRRQPAPPPPRLLRRGNFVIDLERKTAVSGQSAIKLTKNEFAVLELLARHPDRPVPRATLLNEIWGNHESVNSHALDTCIWRLRGKIEKDKGCMGWIKNVPGIGYLLEVDTPVSPSRH